MATNNVQIEITAIDKAGGVLDKIQVELKQTAQAAEKSGKTAAGGMNLFGKSLGDIKSLALGVVAPIAGLGVGLTTVRNLLVNSVNNWADYNEQIRKFSMATGAAPEDISRLMQAADDLGVSMDSLGTALGYAARNGIVPTVSNMAKLSDELLAIKDPAERAQLAMKIFGRGWVEVAPFILSGSEAIREGTAAIEDNMVATEESIQQSREYKVALDNLQDAWTGVQNTIGTKVMPTVTDFFNAVTDGTKRDEDFISTTKGIINVLGQAKQAYQSGAITIDQYRAIKHSLLFEIQSVESAQTKLNTAIVVAKEGYYRAGAQLVQLNRVEGETVSLTDKLADSTGEAAQQMGHLASGTSRTRAALAEMRSKDIDIKLSFTMPTGDIDSTIESWFNEQKWRDAGGQAIEAAMGQMQSMLKDGKITQDQANEMFGELYLASQKIQLELGQIDTTQAAQNIRNTLGVSLSEAWQLVKNIKRDASFNANATITVRTIYVKGQRRWGGEEAAETVDAGGQNGLNMIVPPGHPDDTFLIGATSGERVVIVPNGQSTLQSNNNSGFGGVNYTFGDIIINATGGQSPEAIARALINQINRQTRASRNAGLGYVS